jgi:hypothetical protein
MQGDQQPTPPIDRNVNITFGLADLFAYLDQPESWQTEPESQSPGIGAGNSDSDQSIIKESRQSGIATGKVTSISDRIALVMADQAEETALVEHECNQQANDQLDPPIAQPEPRSPGELSDRDQNEIKPISYISYTTQVEAIVNQVVTLLAQCSDAEAKAFWLAIGQLKRHGRLNSLVNEVSRAVTNSNYYPDRLNTANSQVSRIFWQAARQKLTP